MFAFGGGRLNRFVATLIGCFRLACQLACVADAARDARIVEVLEYGDGVLAAQAHGVFEVGSGSGAVCQRGSHGLLECAKRGGIEVELLAGFDGPALLLQQPERLVTLLRCQICLLEQVGNRRWFRANRS